MTNISEDKLQYGPYEYQLETIDNCVNVQGVLLPDSFDKKNLFVTGMVGSGKSTLADKLSSCHEVYLKETYIDLSVYSGFDVDYIFNYLKSGKLKVCEGHFNFSIKNRSVMAHHHEIGEYDYDEIQFDDDCININLKTIQNILFEFRIIDPNVIKRNLKIRNKGFNEYSNFDYLTNVGISKGNYLLTKFAKYLHDKGVETYLRTELNGNPKKFT